VKGNYHSHQSKSTGALEWCSLESVKSSLGPWMVRVTKVQKAEPLGSYSTELLFHLAPWSLLFIDSQREERSCTSGETSFDNVWSHFLLVLGLVGRSWNDAIHPTVDRAAPTNTNKESSHPKCQQNWGWGTLLIACHSPALLKLTLNFIPRSWSWQIHFHMWI
jgi:hypothetical protein